MNAKNFLMIFFWCFARFLLIWKISKEIFEKWFLDFCRNEGLPMVYGLERCISSKSAHRKGSIGVVHILCLINRLSTWKPSETPKTAQQNDSKSRLKKVITGARRLESTSGWILVSDNFDGAESIKWSWLGYWQIRHFHQNPDLPFYSQPMQN